MYWNYKSLRDVFNSAICNIKKFSLKIEKIFKVLVGSNGFKNFEVIVHLCQVWACFEAFEDLVFMAPSYPIELIYYPNFGI